MIEQPKNPEKSGSAVSDIYLPIKVLIGTAIKVEINPVIAAAIPAICPTGSMDKARKFPKRKLIVGNPANAIKDVSDEMIAWKTAGTKLYQQLPKDCQESLKEVEPLREIPKDRPKQEDFYKTLQEIKRKE